MKIKKRLENSNLLYQILSNFYLCLAITHPINVPTTESTIIIGIKIGHIKTIANAIKAIALIAIPRMNANITSSMILTIYHMSYSSTIFTKPKFITEQSSHLIRSASL